MKRGLTLALVGVLATGFTGAALAQGFPGGPPFGGPGFGPGAPGPMMLLSMQEVQQELKLEQSQLDALFSQPPPFVDFQNTTPEQLQQRMAEIRREEQKRLAAVLKPAQLSRLRQLELQQAGSRALTRPDVAAELKLTDSQKAQVQAALSAEQDGVRRAVDDARVNGQPPFQKIQQVRTTADTRLAKVLNPAQLTQLAQMQGTPFKFPEQRFGGPGGFGGPMFFGGPGGPGGPGQQERPMVKEYDKNADGWLNTPERQAAREALKKLPQPGRPGGGFGGPGGPGGFRPGGGPGGPGGRGGFGPRNEPGTPGPKVSPAEVKSYPDAHLYEPSVLRTLFLDFEAQDWEKELSEFKSTDVEVPATMTVDGKKYPNVGVRFRGASSFMMIPEGSKRSFNVSLDMADEKQRLNGYRTLNLLNANGDPSFLQTVLYSHIARQYLPAPKANLVKVVVNGESWGVFTNVQQYNTDFLKEWYPSTKGIRWKVTGRPGGNGGLAYLGEDVKEYQRHYEIKTDNAKKADEGWKALIALCKTLKETPTDKLEAALKPMLNVDGVLRFLAVENALINNDGYWIRASDYSLYRDEKGVFHVIPHDMNEAFGPGGGPGFGGPGGMRPGQPMPPPGVQGGAGAGPQRGPGGPGGRGMGGGITIDPLIGMDDTSKPLRSRLLAVPALKAKYLAYVRDIAETWLDWNRLGPLVSQSAALIDKEVAADTRKLTSHEAFRAAVGLAAAPAAGPGAPEGRGRRMNLKDFASQRRQYLLSHPSLKQVTQ